MNNKKLIIIIAAAVAVVAALVVGIVLIGGSIKGERPDEPKTSGTSSVLSSAIDGSDEQSSDSSTNIPPSVIQEGSVGIANVESTKGKTVEVPITLSKNPGIAGGLFAFEYDSSALEYVDYKKSGLFDEYDVNAKSGKIKFIITTSDVTKDVTENGDIVVLLFKVKDNAKKGEYTIKLTDESEIYNWQEDDIEPTIADGKIIVK